MDEEEERVFVAITCTDRGQHRRIRLTTARLHASDRGMGYALEHFAPPMRDAKPGSFIGRDSYVFICPRCGRTPQIKANKWWSLLEAVSAAGQGEFDISLLP
ncbi:hypothetical protein RND61_07525 [Streptomyces sp. TRM76323]|uniref:Uncharacterized protein n=1 Tax=Streptomyces tamarix TaxID=3078565 RepID=A0ABU3QGQ5_9ACTN|nr:hypothetical protein [Streptomyces tamarix]MDT9681924.1 hypothetical protein [Streptomyces tamarix]